MNDAKTIKKGLVIEDDYVSFLVYETYVKSLGWVKLSYNNGTKLPDLSKFDFVILDLLLPKHEVGSLLLKIRKEFNSKELPVIIISSYLMYFEKGIDLSDEYFLNKYLIDANTLNNQIIHCLNPINQPVQSNPTFSNVNRKVFQEKSLTDFEFLKEQHKLGNMEGVRKTAERLRGRFAIFKEYELTRLSVELIASTYSELGPSLLTLQKMEMKLNEIKTPEIR